MGDEEQMSEERRVDALAERYKTLKLTYFPHWDVTPEEKKDHQAKIYVFLDDLETCLLENHWSVEEKTEEERTYRYEEDSKVSLRIRHHIDYFGVHTVYLVEIQLRRKGLMPWDSVVAEGEVVFERLKEMA